MRTLRRRTGRWRCTRVKLAGRRWKRRAPKNKNEDQAERNPKAEIRNPKEGRNPKSERGSEMPKARVLRPSGFELLSDFGLRISAFFGALVACRASGVCGHSRSPGKAHFPAAGL